MWGGGKDAMTLVSHTPSLPVVQRSTAQWDRESKHKKGRRQRKKESVPDLEFS